MTTAQTPLLLPAALIWSCKVILLTFLHRLFYLFFNFLRNSCDYSTYIGQYFGFVRLQVPAFTSKRFFASQILSFGFLRPTRCWILLISSIADHLNKLPVCIATTAQGLVHKPVINRCPESGRPAPIREFGAKHGIFALLYLIFSVVPTRYEVIDSNTPFSRQYLKVY